MATSFIKSFMEAVNPAAAKAAKKAQNPRDPRAEEDRQSRMASNALLDATSREALEERPAGTEVVIIPQTDMGHLDEVETVEIPADQVAPEDLPQRVIIRRRIPIESDEEDVTDPDHLTTIDETGSGTGDIADDAKFFQDAATEYQLAYQELDKKYSEQAVLVQEASEALRTSESHTKELRKELDALKKDRDSDIQMAVGGAVLQFEQRLSEEQSRAQEQQTIIAELQGQIQALQESITSQRDLPSVPSEGVSQEGNNLREGVFNYVPGTVNTRRGAAVYESPDQAYSFQKHVRFGDRLTKPDLESDAAESGINPNVPATNSTQMPVRSSTPYRGVSEGPMNRTFDVSGISPNQLGTAHDAATIAAEVSAAAAAQASKEFRRMREPKITKLRGGYSADAELVFRSWRADILANIHDRELDNKSAIQLIKEQTLDNARREVEFQLDLCGGVITYKDLLKHLSVAFQGGDDEANLLAEFYSRAQKSKETEEAFADELQILARKVIIKKPDFRVNLDTTLKQRYASQLLDRNSASIAKTLLVQMSKCSFTEFRNELARVLDTRRKAIAKASLKPVTTKSVEAEEEEDQEADAPPSSIKSSNKPSTSNIKKDKKIHAQSAQIKDLRQKLDQAVAENSQIRELLSPATLTTAFSNALSATKTRFTSQSGRRSTSQNSNQQYTPKPFLGKPRPSQLAAGKDGNIDPDQSCRYCKDTGHLLENCLRLDARNKFIADQEKKQEEGLNL